MKLLSPLARVYLSWNKSSRRNARMVLFVMLMLQILCCGRQAALVATIQFAAKRLLAAQQTLVCKINEGSCWKHQWSRWAFAICHQTAGAHGQHKYWMYFLGNLSGVSTSLPKSCLVSPMWIFMLLNAPPMLFSCSLFQLTSTAR